MSFDSLGRYAPNHKTWDHVGNIIPQVEASEGFRPHGEFRPAAWLPVQFFDKFYEDYFVVMPGKILGMDNAGHLVPAQYGLASAAITYTATDVEAGVIDVRTGQLLLIADIGTFDVSAVTDFFGTTGMALAVSGFVGVAPYAYWKWAGDSSDEDDGFNPAGYARHNYNMQHRTAILCDYVLELPVVPAATTAGDLIESAYDADTDRSTFAAVANLPVASNTIRTPITFADGTLTDSATRFVIQVTALDDVVSPGDWHIDLETGIVTVYATADLDATDLLVVYTISYSNYAAAPVGSNVSKFASIVGDVSPGDFLICNADSNYVAAAGTESFKEIVGQVIEIENVAGKDYLDRVRTAYDNIGTDATGSLPGYPGQMDQMPGSANSGVPAKVHYAGAADLVARVNLISR